MQNGRFDTEFVVLETSKSSYYVNLRKKLNNPLLQTKTYSSLLKTFYNKKNIALTPPLFVKDRFAIDVKTKTKIFNNFFAEQ